MIERNLTYTFQDLDKRDYKFSAATHSDNSAFVTSTLITKTTTIKKTMLSASPTFTIKKVPIILDQGSIGSCVANAFAFSINTQTNNNLNISRLFHYAICRILQNSPLNQDTGTTIRTACKAITNYGAAAESTYPYKTSFFSVCPPLSVFQGSKYFRKFTYVFVNQDLISIKNCLSIYNVPIIFGFLVYSSFLTKQVSSTGIVPVPNTNNETLKGGHCINIIGYNDSTKNFTCVNSWEHHGATRVFATFLINIY